MNFMLYFSWGNYIRSCRNDFQNSRNPRNFWVLKSLKLRWTTFNTSKLIRYWKSAGGYSIKTISCGRFSIYLAIFSEPKTFNGRAHVGCWTPCYSSSAKISRSTQTERISQSISQKRLFENTFFLYFKTHRKEEMLNLLKYPTC